MFKAYSKIGHALREALCQSYSLLVGILFLGIGYGVYAIGCGFEPIYPVAMAMLIFAGSMEFITIQLLLGSYNPLYAFVLTLIVNGRQLFYGFSIYRKYDHMGWKKPFLVSGLIDESFSFNYMAHVPPHIDRGWFMLFITLLLYAAWMVGTTLGATCGSVFARIEGIDFVMPALFIVILVNQWKQEASHGASLLGLVVSGVCLWLLGPQYFLLPSLLVFTLCGSMAYRFSHAHHNPLRQ